MNVQRDPTLLDPGILADGRNARCRTGQPTTRLGRAVYAWANRWDVDGKASPFTALLGVGVFRDPRSTEWLVIAADGKMWRTRPGNSLAAMTLPTSVEIRTAVNFCQAFDQLFCFRGRKLAPLVLSDIGDAWTDLVARWDIATVYGAGATVARGPWQTASTIGGTGTLATVTTATEHGLITGSDVEIRGVTPSAFNGRVTVTVVDGYTFTYSYAGGAYASGTCTFSTHEQYWKAAAGAAAGLEPGIDPAWTRDYTILPNGDHAISSQNRLLVPTWWQFADNTAGSTGQYKAKRDYVAASDYLDYRRTAVNQYFRVNQGSNDELLALREVRPGSVAAFKSASVFLLDNVVGDLSEMTQRRIPIAYGLINPRAIAQAGANVHWMSPRRGVVSLIQTINNELQGVDVPLSEPIQPWINRINWGAGDRIRMEFWDNKLFVAVPMDNAQAESADLLEGTTYAEWLSIEDVFPGAPGAVLHWKPKDGSREILYANGTNYTTEQALVWDGSPINLYREGVTTPAPADSTLTRVLRGVNNTVLVYDFQRGQWQPRDDGPDLSVREFFKLTLGGEERLFVAGEDGLIWAYEATDMGDMVWRPTAENGIAYVEVETEIVTRGYLGNDDGVKCGKDAMIAMATWAPKYSLTLWADGINEFTHLVTDQTRSRTRYHKPATAQPWDPTNANDDFDEPWREDYSVAPEVEDGTLLLADGTDVLLADGDTLEITTVREIDLQDGIPLDRMQEQTVPLRLSRPRARALRLRLLNTTGRIALRAVNLDMTTGPKRTGMRL